MNPITARFVAALLSAQASKRRFPNISCMFPGMAVIFGLTILTAFLLVLLALSGLYVAYQALLDHGFSPLAALGLVDVIILLVILMLVARIQYAIRRVKDTLLGLIEAQTPIASRVTRVGRSFLNGFSSRQTRYPAVNYK